MPLARARPPGHQLGSSPLCRNLLQPSAKHLNVQAAAPLDFHLPGTTKVHLLPRRTCSTTPPVESLSGAPAPRAHAQEEEPDHGDATCGETWLDPQPILLSADILLPTGGEGPLALRSKRRRCQGRRPRPCPCELLRPLQDGGGGARATSYMQVTPRSSTSALLGLTLAALVRLLAPRP